MKILRIIARLNVGGPARHVVWLTKDLQDEEFQSVLIAGSVPKGEEDMNYFAVENNVSLIFIEEMSRELSLKDAVSLWKIFKVIRKEKPDIIHTHTAKAGTVGRIAAFFYRWFTPKVLIGKPRRVKTVHTYHGHVFHSYYGALKTKIFLFIEKTLAKIATDKIVVISRQQFDEIHHKFGVGSEKQFEIIPLGLDLAPFEDVEKKRNLLREEIGAAENEILVGLVGRLTEIKNIALLLKVAEIYKADPAICNILKLKFIIIGDGNLRKVLESKADELNLGETVKFLGNRSDADVFYAGLDIVALTSLNEGTPLSLIEAMANKKSVISTSVGGVIDLLGEIIEEKDSFTICERGIRVSTQNAEDFYAGLIYLAKSVVLSEKTALNGHRFVLQNYSKERLLSDIKSLYRKFL